MDFQAAFTNYKPEFIISWVFVHYKVINVLYIKRVNKKEGHGCAPPTIEGSNE